MKPRRPQNNAIHLLRLCEQVESGYRLRWDEKFLRPASRIGEAASKQIRSVLCNTSTLSAALIEVGDMLIIDNWRMLHARTPVQVGREDRLIQRVYLEELY
nr:TauD/TfdA family dioxygenase [uncultured Azospirillum sp.]